MKYLMLLLMSCTSTKIPEVVIQTPPPLVASSKTIEDYAKESYSVKGWDTRYSEVIKLLSKDYPLSVPCDTELFLKAIINAESSFNNASYFMEPAPLNKYSIGFFQLSLSDAKPYGCLFKTEKEIENPIYNIHCAMKILYKLQQKDPDKNIWRSGGKYWSVLRRAEEWPTKRQSGFNRVKAYLSKNGCDLM